MGASVGVSGFSTVLIWNYRKVLEILSISGPSQARDMIDLTNHDSPSGFKEFVPGPISGGEVTLEGNFITGDTGGQIAFHTDVQGGTKRNAFIVMPMAVGASLFFAAYAKGFEGSFPYESKIGASGSLAITGKPLLLVTQAAGMSALAGKEYDGAVEGDALVITPAIAVGTYAYACDVDTLTDGVRLTVTCAGQTPYVQGVEEETGVETPITIALGAAGTVTDIIILCYTTATPPGTSPRVYILSVTRAAE